MTYYNVYRQWGGELRFVSRIKVNEFHDPFEVARSLVKWPVLAKLVNTNYGYVEIEYGHYSQSL